MSELIENETLPFISVVVPVYNEEKYISICLDSLRKQDYPRSYMEWIFVDGGSTDETRALLEAFKSSGFDLVKILDNPLRITPCAMNTGIKESRGEYIVRLDAHAEYASDYLSSCIRALLETGADNVGGKAVTKGRGFMGESIAKVLSSKFGVGNSGFRTGGQEGYVDTVPFGAFKREVFEKWGYFDERLVRNQDNEMNYRIRKNGGQVYLSDRIHFAYFCRDTLKGLLHMAMQNGEWNIVTMRLCPGSMGVRHFIPLVFVTSLVVLVVLSVFAWWAMVLLACEVLTYLALDAIFSLSEASTIRQFGLLLLLYPLFHICYGLGSLKGLIRLAGRRF